MKPLRELDQYQSESERTLAQLFSAAEPYRANPFRKRRINVQLGARAQRPRRAWQPAALAVLLVAGTSAAAALGHRWATSPEPESAPVVVQAQSRPQTKQASPKAASLASPEPVAAQEKSEHLTEAPRRQPKAAAAPRNHTSPHQRANVASEDPTRVAEALLALRKEGDAKRAQVLLSEYMRKNPSGALSEEALALAIEAAHLRRDPKAQQFARRYLARYPNGRHTALARRALTD